jgi:hypothetical protein
MKNITPLIVLSLILSGCESTRSISDTPLERNTLYKGELSQLDVLSGFCNTETITRNDEQTVKVGTKVMLIQSGQFTPNQHLVAKLSERHTVIPFSGIPGIGTHKGASWNEVAKLGQIDTAIVYWGEIQTGYTPKGTSALSWVPVAGFFIPDTKQKMRIRFTDVVIDIKSGKWKYGEIISRETETESSMYSRDIEDQKQINELKSEIIEKFITDIQTAE